MRAARARARRGAAARPAAAAARRRARPRPAGATADPAAVVGDAAAAEPPAPTTPRARSCASCCATGKLDDREVEIEVADAPQPARSTCSRRHRAWRRSAVEPARTCCRQGAAQDEAPQAEGARGAASARPSEEADKLIDMDDVTRDALEPRREARASSSSTRSTRSPAREGGGGGPDVSREGVQRDLLPIVEGSTVHDQVRHR